MDNNWIEKETLKEALRELFAEQRPHKCHLEEAGVTVEEHKEHHKTIQKIAKDMTSVRKAFIMGVVTTVTGGILGLFWLYIRMKCEESTWLDNLLKLVRS